MLSGMNDKEVEMTKKRQIKVAIPNVICHLSKTIGGTESMDQNINVYKIGIRWKKMVIGSFDLDA